MVTQIEKKINNRCKKKIPYAKGFTLLEVMVALTLYTFIAMISITSLISMIHANQKSQALKSVINNLNFALEGMERNIRVGRTYHCGSGPVPGPATLANTQDCVDGTFLAIESSKGKTANIDDQLVYRFNATDKNIEISKDSGVNWLPLTSAGVVVESLKFTVEGNVPGDNVQPFVIITLKVSTHASVKMSTTLDIQTSASQRLPDY